MISHATWGSRRLGTDRQERVGLQLYALIAFFIVPAGTLESLFIGGLAVNFSRGFPSPPRKMWQCTGLRLTGQTQHDRDTALLGLPPQARVMEVRFPSNRHAHFLILRLTQCSLLHPSACPRTWQQAHQQPPLARQDQTYGSSHLIHWIRTSRKG